MQKLLTPAQGQRYKLIGITSLTVNYIPKKSIG